jgi:hypothetical protein
MGCNQGGDMEKPVPICKTSFAKATLLFLIFARINRKIKS